MASALGEFLRARRKELELTEQDVAAGAGVTTVDVINYEQGLVVPHAKTLDRLATVLEVDAATLGRMRPRSR